MIADRWPLRRLYLAAKVTRRILFLQFVVRIAIAYPSCEVRVHLPQQGEYLPWPRSSSAPGNRSSKLTAGACRLAHA